MFQWPPLDVSTIRGGPQVNKFEQVSSDNHQMSVSEGEGVGTLPYNLIRDAHEIPTPELNDRYLRLRVVITHHY